MSKQGFAGQHMGVSDMVSSFLMIGILALANFSEKGVSCDDKKRENEI
jgi:hypothetical protein